MANLPPWTIPLIIALVLFAAGAIIFRKLKETKSNSVDGRLATFAERNRSQTDSNERGMSALASRVDSMVNRGQKGSDLARDLAQADLKLTVTEFIMFKFGSVILFALFGVFLGRANFLAVVAGGVVGAIIGFIVPDKVVSFKQGSRLKAFNNQLGDTVGLLANSLRSGYSLLQSMDLVSREAPPPISVEFRRVVQEVGLGLSLEDGMNNLLRRVPSDDLDLMVSAINIQAEVGGNLAEILDTIAHTIRERVRIKGQIRVLTSQARYSGYVVTFLPISIAVIITMLNPDYMAPLMTIGMPPDAWCCMPVCSAMMMIGGFFAIKSIVNIEI
ncbi:MAG TPA: secretion system protein [Herpetosiphon sp.]|uniref:Type II secretion system protein n=1 Tax=Herpetosiphon aurantiacus (strain ATCC 23779 / DSM 785 / 114-95) TaxID=316274 RepID=A9B0M7_HERA2|nr:type II secretion system F family protein [Herpetosiphon sp.]ABX07245.1 type II secretion system protein [Herpetosiphon aurantiacus DSM 785]HBW52027.1 secretion system protein [Herpetosiphon sp.]